MATLRDAILAGASAAARLHAQIGTREAIEKCAGAIDVFGALLQVDAVLMFRPLEGLLGACLRDEAIGVLISTQRPLRIQRFTGAHELGHVMLGHQASLDGEDVIGRAAIGKRFNFQEVAADAFAAEFLLPKWLLHFHARRQGWGRESVKDPATVYQLALRLGASFEATCRALARDNAINRNILQEHLSIPRKTLKGLLLKGIEVEHWHRDIWVLTEHDEGATIEGQPEDIFMLRLRERGGAGYLWDADMLRKSGFAILSDKRYLPENIIEQGGQTTREIAAQHSEIGEGMLAVEMKRPWETDGTPAASLAVIYQLFGKEIGLPRAVRRELLAAQE